MNNLTIIGAGAWGTALAIQAARAGATVTLVTRRPGQHGLPGHQLPTGITLATAPPPRPDAILLAIPTQSLRAALATIAPGPAGLLLCCKGIETATLRLPAEIAAEQHPNRPLAILTGPNFATEIAAGLPAAAIVASTPAGHAFRHAVIDRLATPNFRLYGNDDPIGAQLGGAAKNVIAIAAGAVIGAGLGENARAALVTRGLAEISRLIAALGGRPETAAGLSGLGDLVLTCTGAGSRNFAHGLALGRGEQPRLDGPVVEGVAAAPALVARATGVDLPICTAVARLLAGEVSLGDAIAGLLSRPRTAERVA